MREVGAWWCVKDDCFEISVTLGDRMDRLTIFCVHI